MIVVNESYYNPTKLIHIRDTLATIDSKYHSHEFLRFFIAFPIILSNKYTLFPWKNFCFTIG